MQVKMSEYLTAVKPDMQKLVELLKKDFAYVSVLCTDVTGTTYLVGQRQTSVGDYHFNERGFVVRVYENSCYMEYSFNEYEDIEKLASTITETLKKELHMMEELGIETKFSKDGWRPFRSRPACRSWSWRPNTRPPACPARYRWPDRG